mgnify:CR=1 FL=1
MDKGKKCAKKLQMMMMMVVVMQENLVHFYKGAAVKRGISVQ